MARQSTKITIWELCLEVMLCMRKLIASSSAWSALIAFPVPSRMRDGKLCTERETAAQWKAFVLQSKPVSTVQTLSVGNVDIADTSEVCAYEGIGFWHKYQRYKWSSRWDRQWWERHYWNTVVVLFPNCFSHEQPSKNLRLSSLEICSRRKKMISCPGFHAKEWGR